ncbi:MAG: hypothetical protein WAO88_14305, partial [Roseicyclus sp.]
MIGQDRTTTHRTELAAMFALVFCILWTIVSTALILGSLDGLSGWERMVALLFPLGGLFATYSAWLAWRRCKSLRIETLDGATWYVWIELDGSKRRSTKDPRP